MKKFILALTLAICAATTQAAITTWEVYGDSIADSYIDGTAYLIEIPAGGATLTAMINHIKTNGLVEVTGATGKAVDSAIISEYKDAYSDKILTENVTATYYVLLVDKEQENFLFTNGALPTDGDVWLVATTPSGSSYSASYAENGTEWAANGGTVGVPEPTALALLALGVAGLALRRKNA